MRGGETRPETALFSTVLMEELGKLAESEAELGSSNAEIKRQILETSEKIKRLREAKQASQGQWPLNTLKAPSSQEKSPSPSKSGNILKEVM